MEFFPFRWEIINLNIFVRQLQKLSESDRKQLKRLFFQKNPTSHGYDIYYIAQHSNIIGLNST